jgi:hypothetical protein
MAADRLLLVVAALLTCLSRPSDSKAAADGYTIAYVITAHGRSDVGKVETCRYGRLCEIRSNAFGLSFDVSLRSARDHAQVSIFGGVRFGEPGCCFFASGTRDAQVKPSNHPIRLPIFAGKGQPSSGIVLILNDPVGVLYLDFPDVP